MRYAHTHTQQNYNKTVLFFTTCIKNQWWLNAATAAAFFSLFKKRLLLKTILFFFCFLLLCVTIQYENVNNNNNNKRQKKTPQLHKTLRIRTNVTLELIVILWTKHLLPQTKRSSSTTKQKQQQQLLTTANNIRKAKRTNGQNTQSKGRVEMKTKKKNKIQARKKLLKQGVTTTAIHNQQHTRRILNY